MICNIAQVEHMTSSGMDFNTTNNTLLYCTYIETNIYKKILLGEVLITDIL